MATTVDPVVATLVVIMGAIPGAVVRYYITRFSAEWWGAHFPFGTFIINLSGTLLMGIVTGLSIKDDTIKLLLANGFLASYTTFSTFILDTVTLWQMGGKKRALLYYLGTVLLGTILLKVGIFLPRLIYG
ncbi:MAG: fluoride efflux transporter CrcB [Geminocystis sp.]|nr:fluoride efflux transporter CrcB [Geminocystis sp.]HIK37911.1 fluoride efflux transporter CrcB [Geminocystis sp. M7585_C2015_104]MCS7147013.1 fluoride efflux transporter CrcB [Geminocystis sp.]MCX8077325.1 fluoride efflux transporter CrcB [Geminocystis sp.]MDW8115837.1 fluoride efflux transporter CrcB [Geminocystis sp.]